MAQRLALVIGNDDYHDPTLARLTAPQADITDFAGVLRDPHLGAFDGVQILHNGSHTQVRREIARFFHERQHDDLLLLYFSGHGVLDAEGQLFLTTPDTERDLLDATAITAFYVNRLMHRCRSRRQVLILDCCHSGAFDRSAKGGGVGTEVGIGEAFAGDGTGHIVLAASKATEYAFEGDEVVGSARTSVFTRALIDGIRTGDADLDEDGYITPEELYEYVFRRVREVSPRQTPGKWAYAQTGELILARSPHRRLPDEIQSRLAATDPLIRFRAVDDLAALARGDDVAMARVARQELEERAASDDSFTVKRAAALALQSAELPPLVSQSGAAPSGEPIAAPGTPAEAAPAARSTAPQTAAATGSALSDQDSSCHRAVPWRMVVSVALIWFVAAGIPLLLAFYTQFGEVFLIAAALALILASGWTFHHVLRWAGRHPSEPGIPVLAGLLGLVPLVGPLGYAALLLQHLAPWQQLRRLQRLLVVVFTAVIIATQVILLRLDLLFLDWEEWWSFESGDMLLIPASVAHGMALFVGAVLLMRAIGVQPASDT